MKNIVLTVVAGILFPVLLHAQSVGDAFPDFVLKDFSGHPVAWAQFRGRVVVLNLWMTTCPPCKNEMPMLQQLQNEYGNRGVTVIGISADDKASAAAKFAHKLKIQYTLLLDPILMTSDSEQQKFAFVGLPTTFIVDAKGIIRTKIIGFTYKDDLRASLDQILAAGP
jgi:peroxiredoxin